MGWLKHLRSSSKARSKSTEPTEKSKTSKPSEAVKERKSPSPTHDLKRASPLAVTHQSLPEQLWNRAYDNLKASEPKLTEAYEKILSAELDGIPLSGAGATSMLPKNKIGQTRESRGSQMKELVNIGLKRTETQSEIKADVNKGLQIVDTARQIVSKAVSASPEASLAWTSVCFVIEIMMNPVNEAAANRSGITYVVSRMDWYWNLTQLLLDGNKAHNSSLGLQEDLQAKITELYEKLLLFQIRSICLYRRNQIVVILRDILKFDDWSGQIIDIKEAEQAVQKDSDQFNTEQTKAYLRDLSNTAMSQESILKGLQATLEDQLKRQTELQEQQIQHMAQQNKRQAEKKHNKCLQDLRDVDPRTHKTQIQELKGGLLKDSYVWILNHEGFQNWQTDPQSRLLWIKGDPGKGKTMLLCGIIDELQKSLKEPLSYFFCQTSEARFSNATAVLRGLVYLLVAQQPQLMPHVQAIYEHAEKDTFEGYDAWENLSGILKNMLEDPSLDRAVLMVDALDECTTNLPQLLDLIVKTASSEKVKWIVSSRNWPTIEQKLRLATSQVRLSLELNEASVSAAVRAFIQHNVDQLALEQSYDDETRAAVTNHLTSHSNDTFLWVALVCKELKTVDVWDVPDVIKEVPGGLEQLYERMVQQIQALGRDRPELCRLILSTAAIAYRPLHLREIGHLAGLPKKIPIAEEHIKKLAELCGSFLTMKDDVVYVIHQSARDFLVENPFLFPSNLEVRHREIFSTSLALLSRDLRRDIYNVGDEGREIEEISTPTPDPLFSSKYSCIHWVDHLDASCAKEKLSLETCSAIDTFLNEKYLHWLEALSLLRSMFEGTNAMLKLETLLQEEAAPETLPGLILDTRRFMLLNRRIIETAPLQTYVSALFFSPSRIQKEAPFENDMPQWIISTKPMAEEWDACLQTLEGHTDNVNSVSFSSGDKWLVSGAADESIKVWDASTGTCLRTVHGHEYSITSVAFKDDGQRFTSASSADNIIKTWDAETGSLLQTETCPSSQKCRCISENGRWALLYDSFGMRIWDIRANVSVCELKDFRGIYSPEVISSDARWLASTTSTNDLRIWDLHTGECLHDLKIHNDTKTLGPGKSREWLLHDEVTALAFSSDGRRLACGTRQGYIMIWNPETGTKMLSMLEKHKLTVTCLKVSLDGQWLASGSADQTSKIWDTTSGECRQTFEGHAGWVYSVDISNDKSKLASGSRDSTIKVWDTGANNNCSARQEGHDEEVQSIYLSKDKQRVISVSMESLKLWDYRSGKCVYTLAASVAPPVFSDNSERVAIPKHKSVLILDTRTGTQLHNLELDDYMACGIAFSEDGQRLALGSEGGIVRIWSMLTGECLQNLTGHTKCISQIFFSGDDKHLISSSLDMTVRVWDLSNGSCIRTLTGHEDEIRATDFSRLSNRLVTRSSDGVLKLWDIEGGICIQTIQGPQGESSIAAFLMKVALSSDGKYIASYGEDNTARIWGSSAGDCVQTLQAGEVPVSSLYFDTANSSLVHTSLGTLDWVSSSQNLVYNGHGLSPDGLWVMKGPKKRLWIPPEHRCMACVAIYSLVVLGCFSGEVMMLDFSSDSAA